LKLVTPAHAMKNEIDVGRDNGETMGVFHLVIQVDTNVVLSFLAFNK